MASWHTELDDPIETAVAEAMATPTTTTPAAVDVGNDIVANIGNVYRQGDRDAGPNGDIRAAQTNMIRMGLDGVGEVDGVYGRNTMNGVQDAQGMFGLPRTGVLDQATQDKLNSLTDSQIAFFTSETEAMADDAVVETTPVVGQPAPTEVPVVGAMNLWTEEKILGVNSSNRNAVREVQSILGTTVDGGFGPNTREALENFQRDNGLEVTGAVDNAETYNALRELAVTDETNPAFYGTPAPASPVSLVSETPWSTDRVPTKPRWNVNGERINVTGVERTFNVGQDTLNIIDISESTMPTEAGQRLARHTPTRIVFHNTAGMRDNVVGFMDYNNFASAQFYISRDGTVYEVTDPEHEGNHAMGLQTGSVGIEIEGYPERHPETTPDNMVTPEQDAAAALLGEYLINRYPTINQAVSHREIGLQRRNGNYVNSGKTDGWTALRAFRERIGQTGYDMGTGSNTNTHMGTRVKDVGYFQGDQANGAEAN